MFVIGLLYLAVVLCALAFYGTRILAFLMPDLRQDTGLAIAFGLAGYTAFCGLLEITRSASGPLLLVAIVLGAVGFAASSPRRRVLVNFGQSAPIGRSAIVGFCVFGVLYAVFLINAADWHYGFVDDVLGYLVFPERILSEGSIGRDPFNFRRIESGLTGGGGYLYALFRAGLPLRQTRLADVGVGSTCLLLLVAAHAREQGVVGLRLAIMLLVTLVAITFSPMWNNTPETIGKALLFALLRLAFVTYTRPPSPRRGMALALMSFAAVALKSAYLSVAVAAVSVFYVSSATEQPKWRLSAEVALAAAFTIILMAPWMAASHAVAGTYWYPLLGTGTLRPDEIRGMAAPYAYMKDTGRLLLIMSPALPIAAAAWTSPALYERRKFLVGLALCAVILTLVSQLKFTVFGYRYGQAGMAAILLFYLPVAAQCRPTRMIRFALPAMLALALAVLLTKDRDRPWYYNGWLAERVLGPVRYGRSDWRDDRIAQLRSMQAAVPQGEPLLVLLSWPALLDFRRNPIAVMDHPAMMGPVGLPDADDAAGWWHYLVGLGIRYVAYSYGDEAAYPKRYAERELERYSALYQASPYMVADSIANVRMRETLLMLRKFGTVIYDDGEEFVVRLKDGRDG